MLRVRASSWPVAQLIRACQAQGKLPTPDIPEPHRLIHHRRLRPNQAEVGEAAVLHEGADLADPEDREGRPFQARASTVQKGDGGTAHRVAPCLSLCRLCQMSLHSIHGEPQ